MTFNFINSYKEDLKKSIQFFNPNIKEFEDSIFRTN